MTIKPDHTGDYWDGWLKGPPGRPTGFRRRRWWHTALGILIIVALAAAVALVPGGPVTPRRECRSWTDRHGGLTWDHRRCVTTRLIP